MQLLEVYGGRGLRREKPIMHAKVRIVSPLSGEAGVCIDGYM